MIPDFCVFLSLHHGYGPGGVNNIPSKNSLNENTVSQLSENAKGNPVLQRSSFIDVESVHICGKIRRCESK